MRDLTDLTAPSRDGINSFAGKGKCPADTSSTQAVVLFATGSIGSLATDHDDTMDLPRVCLTFPVVRGRSKQRPYNIRKSDSCPNGHLIFPAKEFIPSRLRGVKWAFALLLVSVSSHAATAQTPPKPMTLMESVQIAVRQSPQARAAQYTRDAAQVGADREKPTAKPTLNATASGTVQGPGVTFPRVGDGDATVLPERAARLDIVLEQPLYRPGLGAARQRYAAQSSAVAQDYRKALSDLALSAQKAYFDVLRGESGVRSAQDGLAAAKRYQELVRHQVEAGLAKPVDSETVAAQVAEAQSGVTQAEGGLTLARLSFNRTLGRPLATPVLLEEISTPPAIPDSPEAAILAAQKNRPELVGLEQNIVAAKAGISLARVQNQPALSVRGQVTEQTPTGFVREHYVAATLELRWPLLDGGKAGLDTKEARAQAQRLEALLEDSRQGIALEVTQAWQKMREARDRVALADAQLRGMEATQTVAEKAYEVGRGSVVEVQGAQREVRAARERKIQAEYDLQTAFVEFISAQGLISQSAGFMEKTGNRAATPGDAK